MAREAGGSGTLLGCILTALTALGCSADDGTTSSATAGTGGTTPGSGGAPPGSGGTTPGSGGTLPGTGGTAPVPPGGISGIWDAIGSRVGGSTGSVIVSIDADRLEVLHDNYMLVALRLGETFDVMWSERSARMYGTQLMRTVPGAQHTGDFPINLFGDWVAGDEPLTPAGAPCQGQLTADAFTGSCASAGSLPSFLRGFRDGTASGQRTSVLPSMFGDLGGVWQFVSSGGGACMLTFEGQRVEATCTGGTGFDGTLEAEFQGTVMSGRLSSGYEFSAQRR